MKQNLCLLLFALFAFGKTTQAQLIYTYAGTGTASYSGDGGSSNAATLNQPFNLAIDATGNIYVADRSNNVIRKISTSGIITTVAGNGTGGYNGDGVNATAAMLYMPSGITVDKTGNLYIVDEANSRVRKVNTSGIITTIAGNGTADYSGDGSAATTATLNTPMGVAIDDTGSIYIADNGNNVIRKIDTTGKITTFAGTGTAGYSGDGNTATAAKLYRPAGLAIGQSGLYIADDSNSVIRMVNLSGMISTVAGNNTAGFEGDGEQATSAELSFPHGVTIDASGNLYIADGNNNRIRKVSYSGNISTIAGNGTPGYTGDGNDAASAELNTPTDVLVGEGPNLYVADFGNNVIRLITSDIAPAFVAGPIQTLAQCQDSTTNLDSMLAIADPETGQSLTWQIISGPAHGMVTGFPYTATSNGGTIVPVGLSYTSDANYSGPESLTFQVSDGTAVGITTINTTINPTPNVIIPSDQTICAGSATLPVVYTGSVTGTTFTWANSNSGIGLASAGTGNIAAFPGVNATSDALIGTVMVTPAANGCIGTPQAFTITVEPTPNVSPVSNQIICNQDPTADINFTGTVSSTNYTWENNNSNIGLASTGTGNIPSFTGTNTGTVTTTATLTVTPTANGCTGSSRTFTISVRPTPTVVAIPDQTVCNGRPTTAIDFTGTVTGTTFPWANNDPSIGLGASGTGNIAAFTAINSGAAAAVATVTVTPTAYTCTGIPQTFTITTNPSPDIVPLPSNETVCNNTTSTPVNFSSTVNGATYTWTNNNTSIGLVNSGTGNITAFTAVNTSAAPIVATVTVIPAANGCMGTAHMFTVSVNPTPVLAATPANQTFCSGITTSTINFNSTVSGTTYTWSNDNTSIGLATSGTGNITPFASADSSLYAADTAVVMVTPTANGCSGTAEAFDIIADPIPAVMVAQANQTVCNGTVTTPVNFSSTVSGTTYIWSNSNSTIGLANSGTGNIAAFTASNNGTDTATTTLTVTPVANGCVGPQQRDTISVSPSPVMTAVADQLFCNGAITTPINFSSSISGASYTWSNNNNSIGLAANGTGNIASFTPTDTSSVNGDTAMINVTPTANGCSGTSGVFAVIINHMPVMTISPDNQTICSGTSTTSVDFSSTTNGTTYTWVNSNSSIGLTNSGTGNIAAFTAANTTTASAIATVSVTAAAYGCVGTSQSFTISVDPLPTVSSIPNQQLCNGAIASAVNFSSNLSGTTYTWNNNNSTIGLAGSGTTSIASFSATDNTSVADTATITVTPMANSCSGAPVTFNMIVNPTPDIVISLPTQTVCNGIMTAPIGFSSSVNDASYTWTNNNATIGLASSGTGNIISFTATNSSNVMAIATITATSSANGCTGSTQIVTINVDPTPVVTVPSGIVFCNGTITTATDFNSSVSGTTYAWTNSDTSIGLASSGVGDIASFIAADTTAIADTAIITITSMANSCSGAPVTFNMIVNPTPDIVISLPAQTVCNGIMTAPVNFSSSVSDASYTWANNNTTIGLASSGTGNIISFTATNNSNVTAIATITAAPSANGCTGNTQTVMINVDPTPAVTALSGHMFCNGTTTGVINFNSTVSGTTYAWANSNTNIGLIASGTDSIASFIAYNNADTTWVAYIAVTPSANGCLGHTDSFTISIDPTPTLNSSRTPASICDSSLFAYAPSSKVSPTTFAWYRAAVTGISNPANSGTGNISEVLSNTINIPLSAVYTYTLSAAGCIGVQNISVAVNPKPILTSTLTAVPICDSTTFSYLPASAVSTATYHWYRPSVTGIAEPAAYGTGNPDEQLVNTTYAAVGVTYIYTVTANSCSALQNVSVNVNPTPVLSSTLTAAVCTKAMFTYTPASHTQPVAFAWKRPYVAGITPDSASGIGDINEVLVNNTASPLSAAYVYTMDAYTCLHTQNMVVTLNNAPSAAQLTTTAPSSICANTLYENFGTSTVPGSGMSYTWSAVNAIISSVGNNGQYSLVSFPTPGTAWVILSTNDTEGCTGSDSFAVNVQDTYADSPAQVVYFTGNFVALQNNETGYQWGYDNIATLAPSVIQGALNQNYYNAAPDFIADHYWVMISDNGCTQKSYYDNTGDAAKPSATTSISIFPNPATQKISVEVVTENTSIANMDVEILDILGQSVNKAQVAGNKTDMDVASLPSGCYLLNCYCSGKKIASARFVKN